MPFLDYNLATSIYAASQSDFSSITEIENALTTLFSTSSHFVNGECGTVVKDATLIKGTQQFLLKANEFTDITLFSHHYMKCNGFTDFETSASLKNDFYLVSVEPGGFQNQEREYCCSDKGANWLSGAFDAETINNWPFNNITIPGSLLSTAQVRDEVGAFLYHWAPFTGLYVIPGDRLLIEYDCGKATYDLRDCPITPRYTQSGNLSSVSVNTTDEGFLVSGINDENYQYFVSDILGREITNGNINQDGVIKLPDQYYTSNFLLVTFVNAKQIRKTFKLIYISEH